MAELPAVRANAETSGVTPQQSTRVKQLEEWQKAFCEWLTYQSPHPSRAAQVEKAEELAQRTITPESLRILRRRPAWKEHEELIRVQQQKHLKRKIIGGQERVIDLHDKVVAKMHEMIDGEGVEEHELVIRAAPKYIENVLDRVIPKKEDKVAQTAITIHLTPKQQEAVEDIPETPFEVLEAETLFDDG